MDTTIKNIGEVIPIEKWGGTYMKIFNRQEDVEESHTLYQGKRVLKSGKTGKQDACIRHCDIRVMPNVID